MTDDSETYMISRREVAVSIADSGFQAIAQAHADVIGVPVARMEDGERVETVEPSTEGRLRRGARSASALAGRLP